MYAVLDLETTGLFNRDRVVEVAIVHTDAAGEVTGQWQTLVNPHRDLGPTDIHHVRAADARRAPSFHEIAGDILELLAGRVPVVHNITFDSRLLRHEYLRMGVDDVPNLAEFGVCTMSWAAEFLPHGGRTLADCCAAVGIANDRPHEALSDALATAQLLRFYLECADHDPPWDGLQDTARSLSWPMIPSGLVTPVHRRNPQTRGQSVLSRIAAKVTRQATAGAHTDYLALIDTALLDGHISDTETDELVALAASLGVDRPTAESLHLRYLRACAQADPLVHRSELLAVAEQLDLPAAAVDEAMLATADSTSEQLGVPRFSLHTGDTVVLTGRFRESKEHWAQRFTGAGLTVAGYVTRNTALVVAADPDSMSGKATRARQYKIPVVRPEAVTRILTR